jgi:hypothetical protein
VPYFVNAMSFSGLRRQGGYQDRATEDGAP